jgi:transcriptional regulator NrdR family protein
MSELDDQAQTRLAMAALFAGLVRALERRDVTSRKEVEDELQKIYRQLRENPTSSTGVLETIRWAGEMLGYP